MPSVTLVNIFHGDFQWFNSFFNNEREFVALSDWELWGVGASLNGLDWFRALATYKFSIISILNLYLH